MREIIGAYHRCCSDQIIKAGGFVAKYMGDGVLAYFGYPQAHEDDAERGIRAALALIGAVPRVRAGPDAQLQVRVGIATGLVVVGDLIGEGAAREQGVVGETPNVAARLQVLAEPGQVVISNSTRRLASGMFKYRDLGRVMLKGLADPTQAWQVVDFGAVRSRFEAQHETSLTPLVGREEELELLMRRWRQAASGKGRVVLLSGEPGIGKSRLTVALQERLQAEPHTRLRYFCSPRHTDSALYPIISHLERAAGFVRHDTPDVKLDKLIALLAPTHERDIQLLAELLSIPTDDRYAPLDWSAQRKKHETFRALVWQLEMLGGQRPLLMTYEDVHWIDPSARELLDITIEHTARLPLLLVITLRPEFQPPWTGKSHVTTLTLNRLGRRDGAALIGALAGGDLLQDEMVRDILERADGIPLFVEELAKAALETGSDHIGATTVSRGPLQVLEVPDTLHAPLMARLDRLGPAAKEIAQLGATIGREFSYDLVLSVAQKSDAEMRVALGRLEEAGLVFRQGTPPQAVFQFKHALLRDAAYSNLLRSDRRHLHKRVAEALERVEPEIVNTQPEVLAYHNQEAGFVEPAAEWWGRAGSRALERSAYHEAIVHIEKAIGLAEKLGNGPSNSLRRLQLQISYGNALAHSRGQTSAETAAAFSRARELAASVEDPTKRASAFYGLWSGSYTRGDLASMREVSEAFLHDADRWPASPEAGAAHRMFGTTCWFAGDYVGARSHIERALATYDYERDRHLASDLGYDIAVIAMLNLAVVLWPMGQVERAVHLVEEALRLAARGGHVPTTVLAHGYTCLLAAIRRNPDQAAAHAAATSALAREHAMPLWLAHSKFYGGWARWWTGDRDGQTEMQQGMALFDEMDLHLLAPFRETLLAEAKAASGEFATGLRSLDAQLAAIERTGERWFHAEALRVRGELLLMQTRGDAADVEDAFLRAIEVAADQRAASFQLRASTSLARLWRDQGKRTEARDLLAPIYSWFTEGFDTPDLKEAKALLDELS